MNVRVPLSKRVLVRGAMFAAAFLHSFPATKHARAFIAQPSWSDAWKAIGALAACAFYLMPPTTIARGVVGLWKKHRALVALAGWTLAWVHAVPALDHVPKFVVSPTWADGWRGIGALVAAAWFAAPIPMQSAIVRALALRRGPLRSVTRHRGPSPCETESSATMGGDSR